MEIEDRFCLEPLRSGLATRGALRLRRWSPLFWGGGEALVLILRILAGRKLQQPRWQLLPIDRALSSLVISWAKLQFQSRQREVDVLKKSQQGDDERNQARNKQDDTEQDDFYVQERGEEQSDDENRRYQHTQSRKADGRAEQPRTSDQDFELRPQDSSLLGRHVAVRVPKLP